MTLQAYPKRLIEVDLPIARISAHARREKSIRHGHISTLHIWWARRPLAACRAVICAALWPDPASEGCPEAFVEAAQVAMVGWAQKYASEVSAESFDRVVKVQKDPALLEDRLELRHALLDFIADFANWDNSTSQPYLETSRELTDAAHLALGGAPDTRPLVVDPFAGGGSIPLEALRVGADAFASDLNPVAVLLNKVVLEYIPKYGQRLADEVRKWGEWVKERAEKELAEFYPKDPDGATPIAYLWARTIKCEGPGCGVEVPLMRSLWLAKKKNNAHALRIVPNPKKKRVDFEIIEEPKAKDVSDGTVARGSATCPCCGYTTPVTSVREQLKKRRGGADDARLFAVVTTRVGEKGRFYRLPCERDLGAARKAANEMERRNAEHTGELSLVPDEEICLNEIRRISVPLYGMATWGDLFSARQALALTTIQRLIRDITVTGDSELSNALRASLAMALDRQADFQSALVTWAANGEFMRDTFPRQALGMVWDFAEGNPWADSSGNWDGAVNWVGRVLDHVAGSLVTPGQSEKASATSQSLPDDMAHAIITDPPYYDAVPYSHLSDFFFVWLRRTLDGTSIGFRDLQVVPKTEEIVVDRPHALSRSDKDVEFYERELHRAFEDCRRVGRPDGIGTVVFASKSTASWEAILSAIVEAGWTVTGSWPIDTEREARMAAQGQARLASSVHIVCRPREHSDGSLREEIGEWRDVLGELPGRIHEWMPRLAEEEVVGADAIFACLGPALEIFSRYSRVEKANGEEATLREYLEHVWAAVSTEALAMIFADADAVGLEPDARLTAMWLWTLGAGTGKAGGNGNGKKIVPGMGSDEEEPSGKATSSGGYTLEFDAARKIAQGLGIHLEKNEGIVEVKGDKARLLPVSERTQTLFGKATSAAPTRRRPKRPVQMTLFDELNEEEQAEAGWGELKGPPPGSTVLDRLHQAMILFAAGRGELMKRFLTEEGIGRDARFWKLAQSLSALYPSGSEEKRWVDGVLARKKGLGL